MLNQTVGSKRDHRFQGASKTDEVCLNNMCFINRTSIKFPFPLS